jgi:hypothetical protein
LAAVLCPGALVLRAVVDRRVLVPDVLEEVDLLAREEHREGERVHGRVAPSLWMEYIYLVASGERRAERPTS